MAPDDHQIDAFALGRVDDGLARISLPDQEGHVHAALAAARDKLAGNELAVRTQLVDPAGRPVRDVAIRRIDHAHHEQVRGEVASQVQCLRGCPIGRRRQVRRQEDPADATRATAGADNGGADNGGNAAARDRDGRFDWHAPILVRKPAGAK